MRTADRRPLMHGVSFYLFLEELKADIRYHSHSRGVACAPWSFAHPAYAGS